MFQHSLLLIYRNFLRFKSSFFINLLGLSTGLACTLLIYLWVTDELKVDRFHEKDERLFQVMANYDFAEGIKTQANTPHLLAQTLAEEMPEVEFAAAVTPVPWNFNLSVENTHIRATGPFVGKDYFNMFSYDLLQGDKDQVLADKNSIVISENLALKLFNTTEGIVGKVLEWQSFDFKGQVVVSGIFQDVPSHSSHQFDVVFPFEKFKDIISEHFKIEWNWGTTQPLTYLVLREGTDAEQFNAKISGFIKAKDENQNYSLFIKPYADTYLHGKYENGVASGGRIEYVRLFMMIALFILFIACVNFMNLSTAKASRRIKEVGIKKVVGASRKTLIFQYLGESLLLTGVSLLLAIMLVELFLPQFNEITGKNLTLQFSLQLIVILSAITLFTGLLAGSYPALYLSGFNPVVVLKGRLLVSAGEVWVRKGLVTIQFFLSVVLIVAVVVVYKQIEYVQTKNLGYEKDQILTFPKEGKVAENLEAFLAEVKNIPGIVNASSLEHSMVKGENATYDLQWEGKTPEETIRFEKVSVYYDIIETLGIEMAAGRAFSRNFGSDQSRIILNEAAIKAMGLMDPVGKIIWFEGKEMQVVGVTKDFHFESLHEPVKPLLFVLAPDFTHTIMVKIEAGKEGEATRQLQELYARFNPGFVLDFKFLDAAYQNLYTAEKQVSLLSRYFAGLAILISCLGLFGLAAFTAERRVKEIGIRKVLGASALSIIFLLSGDFTKLVLLAICVALPVSFFLVQSWLGNFAYSIDLEWWVFALTGGLTLLIALLTVSFQAVKAALINPVKSLRSE